jgi:hypothetical protein
MLGVLTMISPSTGPVAVGDQPNIVVIWGDIIAEPTLE